MNLEDVITIARLEAESQGLDPALVCSVCHHESAGWQPWAIRYEAGFYSKYVMPHAATMSETEARARAFSYGLMQVMGQVARELGFKGRFLTELLDPATNLSYGCKKLAQCLKRHNGDVRKALLAYNGGGDASYPDKVLKHYPIYRRTK